MRSLRWIVGTIAAALFLVPASGNAATDPLRIGLISSLTGTAAQLGRDVVNGFNLYVEEIGGQVAGRPIKVTVEDDEGTPNGALTKARRLVEQEKVHVVAGTVLGSMCPAVAPYTIQQKVPYFPLCAADDVTQRKASPYVVRTSFAASQPSHPFGEYAAKTLGYKRVVTIGVDYAYGWDVIGGFQKSFEESGGRVVQKMWAPLTTQDWAPYISQIKRDADAVFAVVFGGFALRFAKQYQEYGLKGKIPLIGVGSMADETVLPSMGDEILGAVTPFHYSVALPTPENERFVKAVRAKYGRTASMYSENLYTMARWIVEGVKAVNGNVEDTPALLAAFRRLKIPDSPRGPVELDGFGNAVQNIYIRRVERVGGELVSRPIHTYPNVSQFWKYPTDEFLKQPVYGRDYPPCRLCE
jgi:branched-chain amino acid transport system substrate-binding protein